MNTDTDLLSYENKTIPEILEEHHKGTENATLYLKLIGVNPTSAGGIQTIRGIRLTVRHIRFIRLYNKLPTSGPMKALYHENT